MADMETKEGVFQLPITISSNGTVTKVLGTQDTYVDKNIKVEVTTPDATFERKTKEAGNNGEITATVSTTDTTYTTTDNTGYAVTIAADAHVNPVTIGTKDAGFTDATDEITVAAADATQATKTIYVKAGALEGSGTASATSTTIDLTEVASEPESGFYIKANAAGSVKVSTAGWLEKDASAEANGDAYYTVPAIILDNAAKEGKTADDYATVTAPVLTSGGYLYINEGYTEGTKISLATLVPDGSTLGTVTDASTYMYKTIQAYDNDGVLVTGTMSDAALSAITANDATATITSVAVASNSDQSAFQVTADGDISGSTSVAVATRGLATTDMTKTGVISGKAEVKASIAKIALGVETSGNDGVVTPVISKDSSTTAKSSAITTTAPTTGHYVAVSTAALTEDVTISPKVTTEGYGTTTVYGKTDGTLTAGAAASGTYYVAIQDGSHTITENTSSVTKASATASTAVAASDSRTVSGVLSAAPTGAYLTIDGSITPTAGSVTTSSTCTVTEGYVTADSKTTNITESVEVTTAAAATKYIKIYEGAIIE